MSDPTARQPIIVNESAVPTTVTTLLRYGLTALGGVLVTHGFLPVDADVNAIVGAVLIVGSTVWGAWKAKHHNDQKVTMAAVLPDSIAQVR